LKSSVTFDIFKLRLKIEICSRYSTASFIYIVRFSEWYEYDQITSIYQTNKIIFIIIKLESDNLIFLTQKSIEWHCVGTHWSTYTMIVLLKSPSKLEFLLLNFQRYFQIYSWQFIVMFIWLCVYILIILYWYASRLQKLLDIHCFFKDLDAV